MRSVKGVAIFIAAVIWMVPYAAAEEYWIKVSPLTIKGFTVEAQVETNIPGAIVLTARLVYVPPKDEGGFVGTGFVRFTGSGGKARVTVDGIMTALPRGSKLPDGKYHMEVFYNYMWPENTNITAETKIDTNIKGIATLSLSAKEADVGNNGNREDGLRWVVENVVEGHYWDPQFWQNKFGDMEEVAYRGPDDPKIYKMYYVKAIHVTLLIDESNSTIKAYRMGLAHE